METKLKLKVIACDILNREISALGALSNCYVATSFMKQGLHNNPTEMRKTLQEEVKKANEPFHYANGDAYYDYIILGYGLCGNGVTGISSGTVPLVIPKAHDCQTLLLGSKQLFNELKAREPRSFLYSAGWIERGAAPNKEFYDNLFSQYIVKFGEDNAQYLLDYEQQWVSEYRKALFVSWSRFENLNEDYREYVRNSAKSFNWEFIEQKGDESMLERILNGLFLPEEVFITNRIPINFGELLEN